MRKVIGKKYEVYRELGEGNFGTVYLVYSHEARGVYALKTIQDRFLANPPARELFRSEAEVWVSMDRYAYIVRANWVEEISRRLYIAMEYIAPSDLGLNTLEQYLTRWPPDLLQCLRWAIQFCHGMEYAYSKGLHCHRDIKPSNIMVSRDRTVKISDFGLASVLRAQEETEARTEDSEPASSLLNTDVGLGTITHMAPEHFVSNDQCSQRSDIYSFGVVLYQMATGGNVPFLTSPPKDNSFGEYKRFCLEMQRLHNHSSIRALDSPLFPMIQGCLEKHPDRRYQTFLELREELEPLLRNRTGEVIIPPDIPSLEASEWTNKGNSLSTLGRYEEAIACCDKAIDIDQENIYVWTNKGSTLDDMGRYAEAIECYDKAINIDPQAVSPWSNKGSSLCSLERYAEAIECHDKAINIDPQASDPPIAAAWVNKGRTLAHLGHYEEAIACCDKAIDIDPQLALAWENKGNGLNELGRYEEAIACCDKAIDIDPQATTAWTIRGMTLRILGHYGEAMLCYDRITRFDPQNAGAWSEKGAILDEMGRCEEAIECYDKALGIDPRFAGAWNNRGNAFDMMGNYAEALSCYDKAIEADPEFILGWTGKGLALARLGRYIEALNCFDKAIDIDQGYVNAWDSRGATLYHLERYEEALVCFEEAINIDPNTANTWYNRGKTLQKLGRNSEALECLQRAVELGWRPS